LVDYPELADKPQTGPNLDVLSADQKWRTFIEVDNHHFYFAVREALIHGLFDCSKHWPTATMPNARGDLVVQLQLRPELARLGIRTQNKELLQRYHDWMVELAKECSPLTGDVLDLIVFTLMRQGNPRFGGVVSTSSILETRGVLQHRSGVVSKATDLKYRAGFTTEQHQLIEKHLTILANVYIVIGNPVKAETTKAKRSYRGPEVRLQPLLQFHEIRVSKDSERCGASIEWKIAAAEGLSQMIDMRRSAYLPRQVIAYHPRREHLAKGLARYLSFIWRTRHKKGSKDSSQYSKPISVRTVLERLHIEIEGSRHPRRWYERLQDAFDKLVDDGHCAKLGYAWSEVTELQKTWVIEGKRDWQTIWLSMRIVAVPPAELVAKLNEALPFDKYWDDAGHRKVNGRRRPRKKAAPAPSGPTKG
jgi:hypothetical protein